MVCVFNSCYFREDIVEFGDRSSTGVGVRARTSWGETVEEDSAAEDKRRSGKKEVGGGDGARDGAYEEEEIQEKRQRQSKWD